MKKLNDKIWKSLIWGLFALISPPLVLYAYLILIEHFSNINGNIWSLVIYSYLLVVIGLIPYLVLLIKTLK